MPGSRRSAKEFDIPRGQQTQAKGTARHAAVDSSVPHIASGSAASFVPASADTPSPGKSGKHRKKGSKGWRAIFWIALAVLIVAVAVLGVYLFSYWNGSQRSESLANDVLVVDDQHDALYLSDLSVDWDALRAINPEVVAWVYMPDSKINYPVAHSGDDVKYLTETFDGYSSLVSYGTIFLEGANRPDFSDQMNIIYGHNMMDGSMFAYVNDLAEGDNFDKHRTVFLLTPQGNYRLKSFALLHVDPYDTLVQQNFPTEADFASYLQNKIDRSVVPVPSDVPTTDRMTKAFALLTCDDLGSDAGRYVLYCYVAESTVPGVQGTDQTEDGAPVSIDPYSVDDLGKTDQET